MKKYLIFGLTLAFLLIQAVSAVEIERSYQVDGLNVSVEIEIKNDDVEKTFIVVEDCLPDADCTANKNLKYEDMDGFRKYYLRWKFNLSSGEVKTIHYSFIIQRPGEYILPPTKIYTKDGKIEGEATKIVVKCNMNGVCEIPLENSLNCPQDCPTGIKDNICDAIKDNRVDPDCKEGVDPDDTVIYEEKITEKHRESNKIVYSALSVFSLILAGMVIIVLRFKKKQK
ncbi:MAG: hypothetical protein DRN25_00240 [Thermoplasmata archaeon]|nr:MAG: hypothetical protein DRN25_00240 [Thermoplasmata archaeon]